MQFLEAEVTMMMLRPFVKTSVHLGGLIQAVVELVIGFVQAPEAMLEIFRDEETMVAVAH